MTRRPPLCLIRNAAQRTSKGKNMKNEKGASAPKNRKKLVISEESLRRMKIEDEQLRHVRGGEIPNDPKWTPGGGRPGGRPHGGGGGGGGDGGGGDGGSGDGGGG